MKFRFPSPKRGGGGNLRPKKILAMGGQNKKKALSEPSLIYVIIN
jgi:hypothetical protein